MSTMWKNPKEVTPESGVTYVVLVSTMHGELDARIARYTGDGDWVDYSGGRRFVPITERVILYCEAPEVGGNHEI